jgi:hypothetical protein
MLEYRGARQGKPRAGKYKLAEKLIGYALCSSRCRTAEAQPKQVIMSVIYDSTISALRLWFDR